MSQIRLSYDGVFDAKREAVYTAGGKEQMTKQLTAKEHVEIFLKFNSRFIPACWFVRATLDTRVDLSSLRFDLAIINIL